ncbi:MAG: HupE/UreJ family protein [Cytophagales bacterium]|nr:HupE/UreJ family protein [Cytophagales bacterium]
MRLKIILFLLAVLPFATFAHDVSGGDRALLESGGLLAYIWVGAKHMLTGYDHLLFLVGVIFHLKHFRDIVRFITAFTVGHSITLISATYLHIAVNEHLIDAIIGLSVLYKGFENLGLFQKLLKSNPPHLMWMVFLFGLIHGLGLSARLQSFAMDQEGLILKILSFNLGVELGQILALIPIVLIINYWRTKESFQPLFKAVNTYLILAGIALAIYQILQWGS